MQTPCTYIKNAPAFICTLLSDVQSSSPTAHLLFFPLLLRVPSLLRRLSFRDQRARSLSSLSLMCQGTCLQLNSPSEQLGSASQRTVLIPRFSHTDKVSCLSASHVQAQKISMKVCVRRIMEQTHKMKEKVVFMASTGCILYVFSSFFFLPDIWAAALESGRISVFTGLISCAMDRRERGLIICCQMAVKTVGRITDMLESLFWANRGFVPHGACTK